ncbi:ABC transporter substrate-binding protein [Paenibacillaceae bacterium WGS1546]|uniref:ABC transporter substrate-binding protein n=1 Tax=Cohnella sp. WGS1546 TaxID=3366810 RepID=UPI00372D268A
MKKVKKTPLLLSGALFAGLLAGCSSAEPETSDVPSTIKVMYYDERAFYQQYGMLFAQMYPNIEIEVVSTSNLYRDGETKDYKTLMEEFIEEQQPDILMLSADEYAKRASEGKLYNLETFITKDEFDLEGIAPGILDYIKQQSDGILYGLAPNFYSQAIFYNKKLFEKHGVTLPEDRMTWEQLLQLAARFPTTGDKEDRVYGLRASYQTDLYNFGMTIGATQGLTYINPSTMQLSINSDSWKAVYEMADRAMKSETLYEEDPNGFMGGSYEEYLMSNPFIGGKVAMSIDSNYVMDQIKEAQKMLPDKIDIDWDIVTVPVNPQNPEESSGMSVHQIFAINANTANPEAAWKFVGYINGDNFARVTSKLQSGGFPSRTKYLENPDGKNIAAFYSLKPMVNTLYKDYEKIPQGFHMQFGGMAQQEFQAVKDGNATIAEALDNLQVKGQQLLTEEAQKAGQSEADSGSASGGAATESSSESSETVVITE